MSIPSQARTNQPVGAPVSEIHRPPTHSLSLYRLQELLRGSSTPVRQWQISGWLNHVSVAPGGEAILVYKQDPLADEKVQLRTFLIVSTQVITIVDAVGGRVQRELKDLALVDWLASGNLLVAKVDPEQGGGDLAIVDQTGQELYCLPQSGMVSPDGKFMLFVERKENSESLSVIDVVSGKRHLLPAVGEPIAWTKEGNVLTLAVGAN